MAQVAELDTAIAARTRDRVDDAQTITRCATHLKELQRERVSLSPSSPRRCRPPLTCAKERLAGPGVTVRQVKEWAVGEGLLAAVTRGTVADSVIDAFQHAQENEVRVSQGNEYTRLQLGLGSNPT